VSLEKKVGWPRNETQQLRGKYNGGKNQKEKSLPSKTKRQVIVASQEGHWEEEPQGSEVVRMG
jgi:hypothetical protein